jgi:ABC-type glycerol-3-phosphate transport system substrate-binding protein
VTISRHIRQILGVCLALLALAACGGAAALSPTANPAPPSAARTVLLLWHAWPTPEDRVLAALVERYNRATPGVQIVLQSHPVVSLRSDLASAVAEGGGPHMAILPSHSLGSLAGDGSILALDKLIPEGEVARLMPAAVGAAQVRAGDTASLYGVPLTFDTLALYYNRANFTGDPPADTDALLRVARGITDTSSDPPYWGLAYNLSLDRTLAYLYAFGGRLFDDAGGVALGLDGRAGAEAWLSWLLELREDERILASLDGVTVDNAITTQQAMMTIDWAHALSAYSAIWPGNLGVAPLPRLAGTDGVPQPYVQSDVLVLNARLGAQAEQAAAAAFASYLIDEAAQRDLLRAGRQPVLLSLDLAADDAALTDELRAAAVAFRAQAEDGLPMPNNADSGEVVWPLLTDMHNNALRRLLTPAQAVEGADSALRARLEESEPR